MSNTHKLIMNFSRSQQFCKFISSKMLHNNSPIISKTFVSHKLKITSHKILSNHVQPAVHFSNSTPLNSDTKTMGADEKKSFDVHYDGILKAQNDSNVLIIDVREKEEIDETGKLPGSIHIPMGEVANTLLSLTENDFKDKFNRSKPSKDTKIILSCRSGKRSGMVQEEIQKLGYENAYNYVGGWLDWESNKKA
ncbi:Thiosulfate sulfurtransferase/rhodanese-like domain-containing protein 3 [Anthophora plagiata]